VKLSDLLDLIESETRIKPEWEDPSFLADLLPRLASLYASLGQFIADAERDADNAEVSYKVERESVATSEMEDGRSAVGADKQAVIATEEERREWIKLKHKARLLFLARQSLDRTIEAIRSKLSFIKSDKENSRV
jgi:hypothetical protein